MQYRFQEAILPPIAACVAAMLPASGLAQEDEPHSALDSIVVVGTQPATNEEIAEIALTPGAVTLVEMDDFRERNVSSLADVLRYVPGLWSASDSGNDTIFLSSRGSNLDATDYDMNGIKLLQDGLPVTAADGSNHNRVVDPMSAHHVTIARGANALKYGASTLGGAISFTSPTAHDSAKAITTVNGGSHGQLLGRVLLSDVINEGLDGLVMLEGKRWDGYREHNRQDRRSFYGNLGWRISDSLANRLYVTLLEDDQELPGALTRAQVDAERHRANPAAVSGNYQIDVDAWRLASRTAWQIDSARRFEIGFSLEEQSLFHPIVDRVMVDFDGAGPADPVEVFSLLIDTDQRDAAVGLRYEHRIGSHNALFGLNYATHRKDGGNYRNLGGRPNGLTSVIDNGANLLEAFAMDRWQVRERTTLILGAQIVAARRDVRTTDLATGTVENPTDDYSSVNPRIGVIFDLGQHASIYSSLSRLFEPPTNYELEDNVLGGGATLDAMKGGVFELGTRGEIDIGRGGVLGWDVAAWYAEIQNEILSVEDPAAPGTSLTTNIEDTVHAGIEGVMFSRLRLGSGEGFLESRLSLSLNDFHFERDPAYGTNQLPAAPRYVLAGEVMYRAANGFHIGPTFELVGKRYADFANSYSVDSYSLFGLRAGFSRGDWSFYVDLRNVLDENYIANHGVRNVAFASDEILNPGMPRSVYFGAQHRIE